MSIRRPLVLRFIYSILGLIIIPGAVGITVAVIRRIALSPDIAPNIITFFAGFFSYLIFFVAFRKPTLAYVFGHELTHALWVIVFRGKVKSIHVSKNGGHIKASKANPFIILAPYFFPFYTLIVIGVWILLRYITPVGNYFLIAVFLIGFTWSFHLLMNIYILRETQEDIRALGHVFSAVLIYTLNIVILGLLITFICPSLTYRGLMNQIWDGILYPYEFAIEYTIKGFDAAKNFLWGIKQ